MVKITGGQRIDLLGVRKEDLPDVWRDLGMPSGHAYTKAFRTCKTCVGSEFCRYGVGDSTALGIAIETAIPGRRSPAQDEARGQRLRAQLRGVDGQGRGVVAVPDGWQIYVGGAAGLRVRAADLLATVDTPDEALTMIGRFIQYYRENARYAERSYAFVERIGIEKLRALLVDDAQGEAERLDREIEAAIAAYRDPWTRRPQAAQTALNSPPNSPFERSSVDVIGNLPDARCAGPDGSPRRIAIGSVDLIAFGEGRCFALGAARIAVFRLRDDGVLRSMRAARTRVVRWPTVWSEPGLVVCPLHA